MAWQIGQIPAQSRLADRVAIEDIVHFHCRGVDRADAAALKHCYWPNATTAYGEQKTAAHPFCEALAEAIKGYQQTHHLVSNILIDFAEDSRSAQVETYLIAFHYAAETGGEDKEMTYLGRYLDQFEKREDIWKILHRTPVMSWSQNSLASHDSSNPALSALARAGRFPDDGVYCFDDIP